MGIDDFRRRMFRLYGENASTPDVFGRAPASARQVSIAINGMDGLTAQEQAQLADIQEQTGVSMETLVAFFVVKGRFWGERKKSFINSVQAAQDKHGKNFANYILPEHVKPNGKIKVGDVLEYWRERE